MEFSIDLPPYHEPASMVFAHSTRIADSWHASPERIFQPEMQFIPAPAQVRVFEGSTAELKKRTRTKNPIRRIRQLKTLDLSGLFLFDDRDQCDTNMGHYIVSDVPLILMIRDRLSALLGRNVEIHVILKVGVSAMAQQIFSNLNIPVIMTDANALGNVIDARIPAIELWSEGKFLRHARCGPKSMTTEVYKDIDFRDSHGDTPEKLFVSRKGSRTITNEQQITDLLVSRGYTKVYFELDERPVREQWRMMAGAREIVGIHGAALSTLVFNKNGLSQPLGNLNGLRLVELFGAGYYVDFNRQLMSVLNGHWCGVRGQIQPEIVRDLDQKGIGRSHQASSFRVDPDALEMALEYSASLSSVPYATVN